MAQRRQIAGRIERHVRRLRDGGREWAVWTSSDRVVGYHGPLTDSERTSDRPDRFDYEIDAPAVTEWWHRLRNHVLTPWSDS